MGKFKINTTERPRRYELAKEKVQEWGGSIEPKDENNAIITIPDEHDAELQSTFPMIVSRFEESSVQPTPAE